ncbi:hypothetical protein KZY05_04895 [Escherichia coli]|nr:hypothetical protein [Escherichia coli]QYD77223.1 hypothetical protein KZY05_04895 [Escherichia coli]
MIWQPEFTDKTLSRKTGAVQITLLVILIAKPSTGLGEVLVTINLLNALVWLAINLVNRLRERLVNHRDQQ